MKITKQQEGNSFKPVTLSITFETQWEVDSFTTCVQWNSTIPAIVARETGINISTTEWFGDKLGDMLEALQ